MMALWHSEPETGPYIGTYSKYLSISGLQARVPYKSDPLADLLSTVSECQGFTESRVWREKPHLRSRQLLRPNSSQGVTPDPHQTRRMRAWVTRCLLPRACASVSSDYTPWA